MRSITVGDLLNFIHSQHITTDTVICGIWEGQVRAAGFMEYKMHNSGLKTLNLEVEENCQLPEGYDKEYGGWVRQYPKNGEVKK